MKWSQSKTAALLPLLLFIGGVACGTGSAPDISGAQLYQQNCASCHGAQGEGGAGWQIRRDDGSYPPPPHDRTGHTWHHSDGLLFKIVKDGGASLNIPKFKSGMPAFGEKLEDEEIREVINHLKTFWEPDQREMQSFASESDPFPE